MNLNSKRSRTAAFLGGIAVLTGLLTGCGIRLEDAQASPHRIEQTDYSIFGGYSWKYVGPSGKELPLTVDCDSSWIGNCWASEDGFVEFRYTTSKSNIGSERITLDGVEWSADCVATALFSRDYICAPVE